MRPPNVVVKLREVRTFNKKVVAVYQSSKKSFATETKENVRANKSMRFCNAFNPSHCLSMRLDDGEGPSRASLRSIDGLAKNRESFPSLKERLEQQKRELNFNTDDPQYIKFLKYGIRREFNEWSPSGSLGDVKLINKKLICSNAILANFSYHLTVNVPKGLNRWKLKDREKVRPLKS